jgi:hypothetical protein
VTEEAEHGQEKKQEVCSFTPKKMTMMTNDGTIHDVMQMNGSVFCQVCNVSTRDVITMMCHLQGTKHIPKARQEAGKPPAATATIASTVVDGDPQMVAMRINGVQHNVRRVGDLLMCELCDVKVPSASEGVMRSHLSGKIHTKKLKALAAAVDMGAVGKAEVITMDVASSTNNHITETPGQEVMKYDDADTVGGSELVKAKSKEASLITGTASHTQGNDGIEEPAAGACVLESMAPNECAMVGYPTAKVVEKRADPDGNSTRVQEMEAVKTDGIAVMPADQELKYQVEGKEFIVLHQPDGRLSCRLCGVYGCEKNDMINHLYTHLGNVHLAD